MERDREDKAPDGVTTFGVGFVDEHGPVYCGLCEKTEVMIPHQQQEGRYRVTHKCPCGNTGLLMTLNGVPQLMHPSEFF